MGQLDPLFKKAGKLLFPRNCKNICFYGDFHSWSEAGKATTGYDDARILEKVKAALLKVKNNEAVYERDSVLFDRIEYSWPLLAGLMWAAAKNNGRLNVLDFGGSLGSTYFQNRLFIRELSDLTWNIVEQENFVVCGREFFSDEHLRFYLTIEECLAENAVNVMVLSSVMQYVEKPHDLLKKISGYELPILIFDRTTFIEKPTDLLSVQEVPENIYRASYPCWFFNEEHFLSPLENRYTLIAQDTIPIDYSKLLKSRYKASEKILILKLRGRENVNP